MSQIQLSHLSFAYPDAPSMVFEDVSVNLDSSWRLGLIGRNGRGKTTLLKLLAGQLDGYSGSIQSALGFEYFPFAVADLELAALDVAYAISPGLELWQLARELPQLGFAEELLYLPYCYLSAGEQTKLLLAVLFAREGRFLLIDEPTNHLDEDARCLVSAYLRGKQGFILVSHDRGFLDGCINHVLSINRNSIEVQSGNFSSWWQNTQLREQYQHEQNQRLRKEVRRLAATAARTASWSASIESGKIGAGPVDRGFVGHRSAKMMKRAKSIENRRNQAVEQRAKLLQDEETADELGMQPLRHHSERLLSLDDVVVRYGDDAVCGPLRFELMRGERLALRGANGSGKSSLLKLLLRQARYPGVSAGVADAGAAVAETAPAAAIITSPVPASATPAALAHDGSLTLASRMQISYVSQDTSALRGSLRELACAAGIDESRFLAMLRKLGLERSQFVYDIGDFSSGQKKKVLLAQSLCQPAHLYLWDEPLNFIDVLSRMQIEDVIMEYQPTMLVIEHDSAFVKRIATRELRL